MLINLLDISKFCRTILQPKFRWPGVAMRDPMKNSRASRRKSYGSESIASGIFLGSHGMWHGRLYQQTTAVRGYPERSLVDGEEKKKRIRGWSKGGFEKSRGFRALLPFFLRYPPGSSCAPWEIGLNGVVQNRFSKITGFRRVAVSNDRDKSSWPRD